MLRFIWGRALTREESLRSAEVRLNPAAGVRGLGTWAGFERDAFCGWWTLQLDAQHIDHAFTTLALPRVWAVTMAVNAGSRAVMARLGMRHIRTEVQEWEGPLPGWGQGEVYYEIERCAWLEP